MVIPFYMKMRGRRKVEQEMKRSVGAIATLKTAKRVGPAAVVGLNRSLTWQSRLLWMDKEK